MKITQVALIISMLFLCGCTNKTIKTAPIKSEKSDFSSLLMPERPQLKIASNDNQAGVNAWDLYAYIIELESALNSCLEINKPKIKE